MQKHLLACAVFSVMLAACSKSEAPQAPSAAAPEAAATPAATAAAPSGASDTSQPALEGNTEAKVLNIYNWPDYIPENTVADFEKETGIKVNYQTFENNEALHAKLVAGNSGYDLVVPGAVFAQSQIKAGLLQKLDKSKIPNYKNLDAETMGLLVGVDPGNEYIIPWAWGFTTVGINKAMVAKALGNTPMPANAWDLVFNPTYTSKLKSCGIAYLDSPTEILPPALHYVGKAPYSDNLEDYKVAGAMLAKVRPDVRIFSSTMIDDLAGGRACVALGWSGDINIASDRAKEINSGHEIETLLPETGGISFFDNMAIPTDAKQPKNALAFINYMLRPAVSASISNEMNYPTANKASLADVSPEIASNQGIFPPAPAMAKMVKPAGLSNDARAAMSNVYTAFKRGG